MPQKHTALTKQNLQIYPTERLTDADDGGVLMVKDALTGRENELFTPISDVARTIGAFNARSVHGAVRVADNIPLGGAHMIISRPPKAENVSYLLYRGVRYGEVRKDIIKRIAAYSVATIESRMTLLSTQSQGSRIVQAYQRPGEPLPLIGDVYCLRQDKAGYPAIEQYVQVIRVSSEDRTFTTPDGKEFVKTVVKMETSTALTTDFIGVDYPEPGKATPPCKIRETHIADGAQYYGVKPLTVDAKAQALKIRVPTLMEKLVPTAQVETALTDLTAAGQAQYWRLPRAAASAALPAHRWMKAKTSTWATPSCPAHSSSPQAAALSPTVAVPCTQAIRPWAVSTTRAVCSALANTSAAVAPGRRRSAPLPNTSR